MPDQKQYSEINLVAQLKSGSKEAFDLLYERYAAALYGIVCKIVSPEESAQDVLQESFVKIWKNINNYQASKGTLFTWMLNITRNTAIDYKRSKHQKYKIQNDDLIVNMADESSFHEAGDHVGLKETIMMLRPEHKILLDYLYLKGYTQDEASRELGIPLGTVKTRIRSALMQLRDLLKEK